LKKLSIYRLYKVILNIVSVFQAIEVEILIVNNFLIKFAHP